MANHIPSTQKIETQYHDRINQYHPDMACLPRKEAGAISSEKKNHRCGKCNDKQTVDSRESTHLGSVPPQQGHRQQDA
jgi:hypothetical protein